MEPANTILIRAGEHSQTLRVYPFDVEQLANPALALSVLEGRAHANTMSAALDLLAAYARYVPTTPPSAAEIAMENAFTSVCLWLAKQAMPPESHAQIISGLSMPGVSLVVSLKDGRAEFQLVTLPPKSTAWLRRKLLLTGERPRSVPRHWTNSSPPAHDPQRDPRSQ